MGTWARPVAWQDWAVPLALLVWSQLEIWVPGLTLVLGPRWLLGAAALGSALALLWRRTRPLAALFTVCALLAAPLIFGFLVQGVGAVLLLVVAVFACGRYADRPAAFLAVPLAMLCAVAESVPDPAQEPAGAWAWALNAIWVFGLGAAFRHERRLREEADAASGARLRMAEAEERLRLARDLHDVVSHNLAVVVVQAEVADAFFAKDPERSREAIRKLAATARGALGETRGLVALLRGVEANGEVVPGPGLADVPSLVARVRAAGLPVDVEIGDFPPLGRDTTTAAYRVVQESLTNVLRHAGQAATRVRVWIERGAVHIDVHNAPGSQPGRRPTASYPSGHGLQGMGERVASLGGELTSGPDERGGFRVRATLPVGQP